MGKLLHSRKIMPKQLAQVLVLCQCSIIVDAVHLGVSKYCLERASKNLRAFAHSAAWKNDMFNILLVRIFMLVRVWFTGVTGVAAILSILSS